MPQPSAWPRSCNCWFWASLSRPAAATLRILPRSGSAQVVDKFIAQLEVQLADRHVTIELSNDARTWLVANGYDEFMGARPMGRLIQQAIKTPLADEVLFGRLKSGGAVRVNVVKDENGKNVLGFEYPEGPVEPKQEPLLAGPGEQAAKRNGGKANGASYHEPEKPLETE